MASQKQRRRRAKEKRHEYDLVEIDAEGNETVLCASELKDEPRAEAAAKKSESTRRGEGENRTRHAAAAVVGTSRSSVARSSRRSSSRPCCSSPGDSLEFAGAIVQTLFLLAIFVPFSYFMDRLVWRSHEKRQARNAAK